MSDFFIRQGARREYSLSYATDDQRCMMEKATAQTGKLFTTRFLGLPIMKPASNV